MKFALTFASLVLALAVISGCEDEKKDAQSPDEQEMQAVVEEIIETPAEPAVPEPIVPQTPEAPITPPDAVVVTVNGKQILEQEVTEEVQKRVDARLKMIPAGMTVPPERIEALRDQTRLQVTDMLVDKLLINEAIKKKNIEITDQQVDAELQNFAQQNGITLEDMAQQLARSGMTMEDIRDQFVMREKVNALLKAEVGDLSVSEEEARQHYDENMQQFSQPETVTASHILLQTQGKSDEEKAEIRKKMEDILKRAKEGEDFAALAKEYSEDPGSKDRGGEYTFPRGQMVKPFEEAAFSLENGQISDIVDTQFGFHIIKKIDHKEAQTQSFDEVKDQIMARLEDQKKAEAWQEYQQKMREDAKIEWSVAEQIRREAASRPPMMRMPTPAPQPEPAEPEQP